MMPSKKCSENFFISAKPMRMIAAVGQHVSMSPYIIKRLFTFGVISITETIREPGSQSYDILQGPSKGNAGNILDDPDSQVICLNELAPCLSMRNLPKPNSSLAKLF